MVGSMNSVLTLFICLFLLVLVIGFFIHEKSQKFVIWLIWDFSGARWVWEKIKPPIEKKGTNTSPSSFLIWAFGVFGIYVALFGLSFQIYDHKISIIENRANLITSQLALKTVIPALSKISYIQNMTVPLKPEISDPVSVLSSLFGKQVLYQDMVDKMKEIIEDHRLSLNCVVLKGAVLQGANLENANLQGSNLQHADLSNADLSNATFGISKHYPRQLLEGKTPNEIFQIIWNEFRNPGTSSEGTILEDTNFQGANLNAVDFSGADLSLAVGLTVEGLSTAKSLYKTKLDPKLDAMLKQRSPHLFEVCVQGADLSRWDNNSGTIKLSRANLRQTNCSGAKFKGGNFKNASFVASNLIDVNFEEADLEGADFTNAKLQVANLKRANLKNANFAKADLTQANLNEANLQGAIFDQASLRAARLGTAKELSYEQLCSTKTSNNASLNEHIQADVLQYCPYVLSEESLTN